MHGHESGWDGEHQHHGERDRQAQDHRVLEQHGGRGQRGDAGVQGVRQAAPPSHFQEANRGEGVRKGSPIGRRQDHTREQWR